MQIILLKDITGLGRRLDLKEVSEGYARNFLLPRKLATAASPQTLAWAREQLSKIQHQKRRSQAVAMGAIDKLQNVRIILRAKTNDNGTLYEGIHASMIAEKIKQDFKVDVHADDVILSSTIKKTGVYHIKIKLGQERQVEVELLIRPE